MKRNSSNVGDTARSRKKAKLQDVRTISTQSPDQALNNGQLDVGSFVKSREFEINQLQDAMLKSKSASSQRAFQSLPRSLRRRAASHNVKRMPKRLRKKTLFETRDTGVPTKPKTKKPAKYHIRQEAVRRQRERQDAQNEEKLNEGLGNIFEENEDLMQVDAKCKLPESQSVHFKKRQKSKTWLPSHVWHAKRAHIDTLWGFSIPTTPSDKCYRSTHRIQSGLRNSAIAFDTSYYSTVILTCSSQLPLQTVISILAGRRPSVGLIAKGVKSWQGMLFKKATNGSASVTKGIGPGTIYWKPYDAEQVDDAEKYKVMIRVHPANFNELWDELNRLADNTTTNEKIHIQDCRFAIGSIDIFGTAATNALVSVLKPRNKDDKFSKRLFTIRNLENPDSLPTGTVLNLEVCDPRLQASRPPKVRERRSLDTLDSLEETMQAEIVNWTIEDNGEDSSAKSFLFSSRARKSSYKLQRTLKAINQRRHNILTEESALDDKQEKVADPSIPVILLKRDDRRCGWTVLAPWHWILPFWFSLMSLPSVKFGGLQELHQLAFETQIAYFPDDFPGLESGFKTGLETGLKERDAWEKRPAGKRIAYSAVDCGNSSLRSSKKHGTGKPVHENDRGEIGDPFLCDWGFLFSLNEADEDSDMEMEAEDNSSIKSKENEEYPNKQKEKQVKTPWMIPAKDLGSDILFDRPDLSRGIFQVCVSLVHRGTPLSRARIYAIPPYMDKHWFMTRMKLSEKTYKKDDKKLVPKPSNVITKTTLDGQQTHPPCPPPDYLIGFVTTGCFSLSEGKGQAIGSLGWTAVESTCGFESPMSHYCLIRNSGSSICRLGTWRVI